MEDIKTATVALRALVELGYPLELSRLIDYLATSPDSKDEFIKFDNGEALYSFLDKFPSMFWVDGSKVFPAQVKPKGVSRCSNTQLPQTSHSVVQLPTDGSDERRQEDQPMGEVEEPDEYKNGAPKGNTEMSCSGEKKEVKLTDSKVGRLHTEDKGDKEGNPSKEEVNSKQDGEVRDDKEENDKRAKDDTQENVNMETLQKQAALHFIEVLRAKGPLPLKRIHGYIGSCPVQVRQAIPAGPVKIRELFLKYPNIFAIDTDDVVHMQPSSITEVSSDNISNTPLATTTSSREVLEEDSGRAEASNDGIGLNGSLASQSASSHGDTADMRTDDEATMSTESSTSSNEEVSGVKRTQDMEALLEEGAAHIVDTLENKGSMPLGRVHGHVNQCREEVRKAIGGGPEKARALFLKFPAYFYIDDHDDVHLTSKLTQECIKAVSASLERKEPLQLGELVSHLEPKLSTFLKRNDAKTFLEHHSTIFVINEYDNMVYLVSAIKKEGVEHFKKVLESKGSLHIKNLWGHSSQYKYLAPMLKVIGGSQSSVMDFLKGFPEVFSIDDDEVVHLTSATTTQSQGNRSYAMVVQTGQKIQTNAPDRSHLHGNSLGSGKSASSTVVVKTHGKAAGKANKESILLEGVQHFKQVLESKGSMPVQNIFGHVNQCRNEVKWAIGSTVDKVKKFLLRYPEVFHIDKKMIVHLVCNRANEQQQEKHKRNIKQLQIEQKALAHFKEMLSRKGPSTTHVLSSCFSSCGEDIRMHVGNSKEGLTKFFMKHPQIFKVDANKVVYLKGTSSSKSGSCSPHIESKVVKPQRWASCDTLAVPRDTGFPKLLSKLSGSTPDVRSTVCGERLKAEEVHDKHSQQPQEDCKDKNRAGNGASTCRSNVMPYPEKQHTPEQKADSSNNFSDKFITAVKDILSEKGCLHLVQLVEELSTLFPHERFELSRVRLFLKKCPDNFHVNNQDMVEELPPMNVFAMVNKVLSNNSCFATLEDTSRVFVYITLYRERMGVDCTRLQDHLSPGDILLVDTECGKPGSSIKWTATNIRAVFKSSKSVDADKNRVNLQTPMPFLPATMIERSPSEICYVIMKFVASFLKVTSPLQVKDLIARMKYLNHDAILYLREKGGLLSFLQSQPQMFQVQDECITLIAGEGELDEGTSQCLASPGAKCTIGKVSMIAKNIAHLHLPDDKKAILDLTDAHNSTTTSCLSVGDCMVVYVVPSNQSDIPWVVSKVKHVIGKAVPAQIHAKIATATHGSHQLKEVLQQCVLETEVNTVLAWHKVLSKKLKMSFESLAGSFDNLPKEVKNYTSQTGGPCKILEKYPTLFHIDNVRSTVCLVECSPMNRAVFFGGAKPMLSGPVKVEGNAQPVTKKPPAELENSLASAADTDKEAVKFFRSKVLEKGQVSVQVLSTCFSACPMAIRHHVGSSQKGLAKFLRDHPNTFSLDENDMVCTLKDTLKTVKQEREMDQIAQKAFAYFKAILSKNGPSTIHVLSSGFTRCDADIRMHVGSSEVGLTNFFMEHPEIFTVDTNQVVSLTGKTSAEVGPSFPPNKDGGGDKLDSNCSSVARLVDAQEHQQQPAPIQAVEENTNDVSNQKQTSELAKRVSDESSLDYHIGSALLQEGNELSSNVQEDRDISSVEDASRSSCHQSPNPPVSPCSQVQHIEDKADQENNQQETEQMLDQAEIEKETLELIVNLVRKCEQVSLRSLQGHINLLGEEKQDCIKNKGGLLAFLQHHYGQIFKIDPTSENVSLKGSQNVQEAGPDFLTSSAKGEQLQPTQLTVEEEVEKAGYSLAIEKTSIHVDICDAENNKNHDVPITEAGDDTGTSSLRPRHNTEACEDVDISTVVTPPALVAHGTDFVSPIPPVQTSGPLPEQYLNQEEAVCDSSGLPTATVHPMTLPSVNSNIPNADGGRLTQGTSDGVCTERGSVHVVDHGTEALAGVVNMHSAQAKVAATHHDDLTTSSICNVALQTGVQTEEVRTERQVSHASTADDTDALPPSSADISLAPSQGLKDKAWTGSKPSLGQERPLHLLVGEDGARVWANPGKQDMQPFAAVCPTETVVPVANPPGQPDDFTSLLPMFKDNLSPIQDNLVEVEMDIGRIPIARYYNPAGPCLLAPLRLSEQPLTRETLETILSALPLERSAIGQGRVLLRGSLHWVSTLKNSLGQVVGLTLRRGQAVPDCLDLLWDMVTSGISTLIVGRPCSGKTTLLREWARVLSDFCYRRVIVVDTLNEIAGGDDVPHPGVGGARRVQVHNRCQQVSQLQAAARNHSPDCIIVDEVQTQEEVTALQAIRLTGIQVVAGVCAGCLTDLLHNSVMRGLLGLSDPPSATSASQGVSQQPLTFPQTPPVFQAAVQIHNRDNLSVYSDVASFVRMSLLEGRFPVAQHRKRVVTKDRETEL